MIADLVPFSPTVRRLCSIDCFHDKRAEQQISSSSWSGGVKVKMETQRE
jgi:hypothetical protein